MEIRVYYECLEQAQFYLSPIIKEGIDQTHSKGEIDIKLIRNPQGFKESPKGCLHSIFSLITPDFLISVCDEKVEVPLVLGEFSESVLTEDHELQRATGGIAAMLSEVIYLKIAGEKISAKNHGGKKDFNPLTVPKILEELYGYKGYFVAKWPTIEDNPYVLSRNPEYLSVPAPHAVPIGDFVIRETIRTCVSNFESLANGSKGVLDLVLPSLESNEDVKEYRSKIDLGMRVDELLDDWSRRVERKGELRFRVTQDRIEVRVYRFSHAADPDRGILTFVGSVIQKPEIITRYIVKQDYIENRPLDSFVNQARSEGVPQNFLSAILSEHRGMKSGEKVDITKVIIDEREYWKNSKAVSTVLLFSDGLRIGFEDKFDSIELSWNREKVFGIKTDRFISNLAVLLGSKVFGKPTQLRKVSSEMNEDEASYIVVHNVLKENSFEVVSVSYPGAQGDAAILPETDRGRSQSRTFVDVIAWLPQVETRPSTDIVLEESKGMFSRKSVEDAANKLEKFKTLPNMKDALESTLLRISEGRKLTHILIGVAFGIGSSMVTTWKPSNVDFIVRVIDRETWQVASFGQKLKEAFKVVEGDVKLPQIYVLEQKADASLTLLEYEA